jgi:hypothetical protein
MPKKVYSVKSALSDYKIHIAIVAVCVLLSVAVFASSKQQFSNQNLSQVDSLNAQQAVLPVSHWQAIFDKEIMPSNSYIRSKCNDFILNPSTNQNLYHFGSNCVDGFVAMFEATGNTKYLDIAIDHTIKIISSSNTTWNGYRHWTGNAGNPLDQSHTWRHMAKMLYVMNKSPELLQNTSYKSKYDQILAFTERDIFKKWWDASESRIANGGGDPKRIGDPKLTYIFRSRTHMASHWAYIGMVLEEIGTQAAMKDEYKLTHTKVNTDMSPYHPSSLRQQMEKYPGDPSILIFHDEWGRSYDDINERPKPEPSWYPEEGGYHPVSDTHHGADTIGYILESYEIGKYWTRADVEGLINLTYKLTWNKSMTDPKWAGFIDGTEPGRSGSNCIEDGQIKLGRYSVQLQKVFEKDTPSGCYPAAFYGSGALNASRLAGAQTPPVTQPPSTPPATPVRTSVPATPKPIVSPTASPSTACATTKTFSLAAGTKWYASKNGYTNRSGLKLQSTNNPSYLAKYNGTQYSYSLQLAYSPNWTTYTDTADFMIYNNSNATTFTICTPVPTPTPITSTCSSPKSYTLAAGVKWYASKNGYSSFSGLKIQVTGANPGYYAPWNGSSYQFKSQLPYSPQWFEHIGTNDFMIYNNSSSATFTVCQYK